MAQGFDPARLRCSARGSVATAIDVDFAAGYSRRCGMGCKAEPGAPPRIGGVCPVCWHRWDYFQILDTGGGWTDPVTGRAYLGPDTEREMAHIIALHQRRQAEGAYGSAWMDGPDDD